MKLRGLFNLLLHLRHVPKRWQTMSHANKILMLTGTGFLLAACGPNEQRRAELAEERRIVCLDTLCDGDTPPKHIPGLVFFKLNGQWFSGPEEYGNPNAGHMAFYWPSKTPMTGRADRQSYPEQGQNFYDIAIEISLRRHAGIMPPQSSYAILQQAQAEERLISKSYPRPGLEVWRIRETDGFGPAVWYVATAYVDKEPDGAVLYCRDNNPKFDRCTTGFIWIPGVAAGMRFRAKHASDWPEIYQETIRVLQLINKV